MVRDRIGEILVDYAYAISFDDLSDDVILEVKKRLLDSLGVAIGGFIGEPVKIAREFSRRFKCGIDVTIWGTSDKACIEWASFTNSLMVRYLDYNDTYLGKEPLHPSDMIPAYVAACEFLGLDGRWLITAIAIAYEIGVRLCDAGSLRIRGWDHVNYIGLTTAIVLSRLFGLDREKALNALSIAVVPHAAMRQSRVGGLTHWKAAATANSVRNAVVAVLLAREGMTGPDEPLVGEMGFIRQLLQGDLDEGVIAELSNRPKPRRILDTYIKPYPVEYHAQTAVEAARRIREEWGKPITPDDVDYIIIDTFKVGYEIIVKHPEKWDPWTRETADHSLPWLVANTLVHGTTEIWHFTLENIRDPRILGLMKKMKVNVDPELDRLYPEAVPNRVTVKFRDGREISVRIDHPKGHPRNPMSLEEVEDKFRRLTSCYLTRGQIEEVIRMIRRLEDLKDLARLLKAIII